MKKVIFIKPALETDAVFDPIRTCSYLGIWYMASLLKERGHQVKYLDEVVRNGGLNKQVLYKRILSGNNIHEEQLNISFNEFHKIKMIDFENMNADEFSDKYSAFKADGSIERFIVRTGNSHEETLREVAAMMPDVVGISLIASANYLTATRLGKAIKESFPEIKVVFGGQHVTANYEKMLIEEPWIDQLITGEAISVIERIVTGEINDKLVHGGTADINQYPALDPSIITETQYPTEPTYAITSSGRKTSDFMFSKGCFRHCEFCFAGSQKGNKISNTSCKMIEKQLTLFKSSGISELIIQDDAFLNNSRTHLPKIMALMKKYGFFWQNNGGLDFEMLDDFVTEQFLMYNRAGDGRITALYIPFNPRLWNKGLSAVETMTHKYAQNFENLKRLREKGNIFVYTTEIVGTPEHTLGVIEHDLELHKDMLLHGYLDAVYTLVATLLPGTKWYDQNRDMIINERDYPGYSLFTTHHKTSNITDPRVIEKQVIRWNQELNKFQKSYKWGSAFPNMP